VGSVSGAALCAGCLLIVLGASTSALEATTSGEGGDEWKPAVRRRSAGGDGGGEKGAEVGPLHGLPVAHKDTHVTAGIRPTYGSPIFADHVPDRDDLVVERIRAAGGITIGKTNTPEFAAGSHTFNTVFGTTRNPYDLTRSAGGSSGGAAAALACGMQPLADGSDMGGSLRNSASFCNVVGLRPSPGRVPSWPATAAWSPLSVRGPMARTVADAALLLSWRSTQAWSTRPPSPTSRCRPTSTGCARRTTSRPPDAPRCRFRRGSRGRAARGPPTCRSAPRRLPRRSAFTTGVAGS
jgi:Asp-tRNA(Asn)/Glu-tRNA(Gln) amidotransferase A subunit family amidase